MDETARRRNYAGRRAAAEREEATKKERAAAAAAAVPPSSREEFVLPRHFSALFPVLEIHPRRAPSLRPPVRSLFNALVPYLFIYLSLSPVRRPFVPPSPFYPAEPTKINDSEILIQWQGRRRARAGIAPFFISRLAALPASPRLVRCFFLLSFLLFAPFFSLFRYTPLPPGEFSPPAGRDTQDAVG